jgi:flagellar basal body P-ring formation protein FlgA
MLRAACCVLRRLAALLLLAAPLAAQPAKSSCVAVAARQLPRGQVLTVDDVAVQGNDAARCTPHAAVVGSVTRRVIAAGEVLREPAVAPPDLIAVNQPVNVVWRDAGIEVRLKGTAMNAAPAGGRVTVRIDVRRRLEGIALAPGLVQVQ